MRAHPVALAATALTLVVGCSVVTAGPAGRASPTPTGDVVRQSLRDVQRFWAATYPALADGAPFRPVQGGFHPYTRTDPPPPCGQEAAEYQPNAFYGRPTQGRDVQLAIDCLAGAWSNDLLTRDPSADIRLSPGDLDEAVAALPAFGRAGGAGGATAFDRIAADREGVLDGVSGCP